MSDSQGLGRDAAIERTEQRFARRMREERQWQALSQAKLAEKLVAQGLSAFNQSAINRIERRADGSPGRQIRLGEAAVIARVLGKRLDEMLRVTASLEEQLAKAEAEYQKAVYDLTSAERSVESATAAAVAAAERKAALAEQVEEERMLTEDMLAADKRSGPLTEGIVDG